MLRELVTVSWNQHQVIRAFDVQIRLAVEKAVVVVLGDDHETIFVLHDEGLAHGAIDCLTDGLLVSGWLALAQVDTDQWHQTTIITGFSMRVLNATMSSAPSAPSIAR